jgi:hypothetical protein
MQPLILPEEMPLRCRAAESRMTPAAAVYAQSGNVLMQAELSLLQQLLKPVGW